jgi:glycosyltransferase involved in cell wall biosynthesis
MSAAPPVVHVVETLERGGLERMVIDLARAQHAAGRSVQVACLYRHGALAHELQACGIPVTACGKRTGLDLAALRRLREVLGAAPGAVVHTHNANTHYHVALVALGLPLLRIVNTRHGMGQANPGSRAEWLYRRSMVRTDAVAAVCEAARARFEAQGVRPRTRLVAIPNGIHVERFRPADAEARHALRAALQLPASMPVMGTVGRLNPVKDQALMLDAVARLRARGVDVALAVAGDGPLREALAAQVERLGLQDRVRLLGDRDDVPALLRGLDVFALSSRSEGYSMALLEACAAGLPIVATDVGGNREIVFDGRNGRLVGAGDVEAFADAVAGLVAEPLLAAMMGREGRAWALRDATVATMAERYQALYRGGPVP